MLKPVKIVTCDNDPEVNCNTDTTLSTSDGDTEVNPNIVTSPKTRYYPDLQYVDISSQDFEYILTTPYFVDKSLLISDIFKRTPAIIIIAPRRFGKTINMNMIKKFVKMEVDENGVKVRADQQPNRKLFVNNKLKIYEKEKKFFFTHFGNYPTIHVSFINVNGSTFEEVLTSFKTALHDAFIEHSYLLTSRVWSQYKDLNVTNFQKYTDYVDYKNLTLEDIKRSIFYLSKLLYLHFNEYVYILIDDYDAPVNNTLFKNHVNVEEVNELIGETFSIALKGNDYMYRAVLTGISGLASVPNNVDKLIFLRNPLDKFYGLVGKEVDSLLAKFKIEEPERNQLKLMYNVYFSENKFEIYSIWSVAKYLTNRKLIHYWDRSGVIKNVQGAIRVPAIKCALEVLCKEEGTYKIKINDFVGEEDVIDIKCIAEIKTFEISEIYAADKIILFLLQQGYFAMSGVIDYNKSMFEIKIPNQMIKNIFKNNLLRHYTSDQDISAEKCAMAFNNLSANARKDEFMALSNTFENLLRELSSDYRNLNKAQCYGPLHTVLYKSKFDFGQEMRTTGYRTDFVAITNDLGVLIEVEYKYSSKVAIQQIIKKNYSNIVKEKYKVQSYILIGLKVDGECKVSLSWLIDDDNIENAEHLEY